MSSVLGDSPRGVSVGPAERLGVAVVVVDVAAQLAREVFDGAKDAPRDDLAFDLGEPELSGRAARVAERIFG